VGNHCFYPATPPRWDKTTAPPRNSAPVDHLGRASQPTRHTVGHLAPQDQNQQTEHDQKMPSHQSQLNNAPFCDTLHGSQPRVLMSQGLLYPISRVGSIPLWATVAPFFDPFTEPGPLFTPPVGP